MRLRKWAGILAGGSLRPEADEGVGLGPGGPPHFLAGRSSKQSDVACLLLARQDRSVASKRLDSGCGGVVSRRRRPSLSLWNAAGRRFLSGPGAGPCSKERRQARRPAPRLLDPAAA